MTLLDQLHADRARFVTRSVANHLNDISKTDPDLVLDRLQSWADANRQSPAELDWITRHALRGLIKSGNPRALAMLGYDPDADISARLSVTPDTLRIGDEITLKIDISGPAGLPVIVDYVLHLHRPTGTPGRKVFKLRQGRLDSGGQMCLHKTQRLQTGLSTYRLHPRPQSVAVQINGRCRAVFDFDLTE